MHYEVKWNSACDWHVTEEFKTRILADNLGDTMAEATIKARELFPNSWVNTRTKEGFTGYLMTIDQWYADCENGFFIDDDGFGDLYEGDILLQEMVYPSERNEIPKNATHILWFNA